MTSKGSASYEGLKPSINGVFGKHGRLFSAAKRNQNVDENEAAPTLASRGPARGAVTRRPMTTLSSDLPLDGRETAETVVSCGGQRLAEPTPQSALCY